MCISFISVSILSYVWEWRCHLYFVVQKYKMVINSVGIYCVLKRFGIWWWWQLNENVNLQNHTSFIVHVHIKHANGIFFPTILIPVCHLVGIVTCGFLLGSRSVIINIWPHKLWHISFLNVFVVQYFRNDNRRKINFFPIELKLKRGTAQLVSCLHDLTTIHSFYHFFHQSIRGSSPFTCSRFHNYLRPP